IARLCFAVCRLPLNRPEPSQKVIPMCVVLTGMNLLKVDAFLAETASDSAGHFADDLFLLGQKISKRTRIVFMPDQSASLRVVQFRVNAKTELRIYVDQLLQICIIVL